LFEHLIHVNSKGESLDFYELGIFQNYNDLRDYEWEYSEVGNRIKNFRKKPVQKTVPYIFIVDEEKAVEIVNKFHEHFDIDIVRKTKGYFKIGEWRLYCYCEGMNFDDYLKLINDAYGKGLLDDEDVDYYKNKMLALQGEEAKAKGDDDRAASLWAGVSDEVWDKYYAPTFGKRPGT
jgi:hypothetical protein